MPEWNVNLAISGPVQLVQKQMTLQVLKGEIRPFETKVELKNAPHGVHLSVIVRASSKDSANDVAVYFAARMLDVLCLRIDLPLYVSLFEPQFRSSEDHVRRIISSHEWREAFELGRNFSANRATFSRALSYYRKGLTSEDPTDKLLAFWAAIETIGSKYARKNERTDRGVINKICDCFDQLWGSVENWQVIPNEANHLNAFCTKRNEIAHGVLPIADVAAVREVSDMIPKIKSLSYNLLREWEQQGHNIEYQLNGV
jgi:hypothetical protein